MKSTRFSPPRCKGVESNKISQAAWAQINGAIEKPTQVSFRGRLWASDLPE